MRNNLSKILGERLLSISEVSRETGISRSTLTDLYYRRTKRFDSETIMKLCNYLQIPMSELLEYEPDEKVR